MSQPDIAHSLYGYRVWRVDKDGRLYSLRGLALPTLLAWTAWPQARPQVATCVRGFLPWGVHRAPEFTCTCGIYAWKEPVKLGPAEGCYTDPYGPHVMGVVQMWGKVVEHPLGYRAEKARPVAVEYNDLAGPVSKRYDAVLLGSLKEWATE